MSSEQLAYLSIWLRSTVAHWLQMDTLHGNEVARIQQLNQGFMEQKDMAEMIRLCFRQPKEGETAQNLNGTQMLEIISKQYPSVKVCQSARVHLAYALRELGYEQCKTTGNVKYYRLVPLVAA